ncbi:MAG: hypothetical protein IPO98_04080 [Saprospiraceae bacterium]|nr:hypothetical protein [Saprospiraceae bacterium]
MDDVAYVALSLYMDKTLFWTGDTKTYKRNYP